MSSSQKQRSAFEARMAAAVPQISKKVFVKPSAPSPQPPKKRTPEPSAAPVDMSRQIYSQPQETGKGENIQTQIVYAIEYLKSKMGEKGLEFGRILSYLSKTDAERPYKDALKAILQKHPQVRYDAKSETFKFRPKMNIFSGEDLLMYLQQQTTFKGTDVKDLKEGWPSADATLFELEAEHKIRLLRNKKDGTPRFVYADDPSLYIKVDDNFIGIYHAIKIPVDHQALIDEVVKEGQTPAGKVGKKPQKIVKSEKKVKKPRRGGKVTNKHMAGILQDYAYLRGG